jgi:hypothetical protein
VIFKLESAHHEELDALRTAFRIEGQPSKLFWVMCEDCGARYFAYADALMLTDGTQQEFETLPEELARDASEILEFDCPRHDDLFEV